MTQKQPFNADVPTAQLRPERVQLQARLDGLLAEPNWAINPTGDEPGTLVGVFQRPSQEATGYLVHLLTDVANHFGVVPEVAFQGGFARITFGDASEEISAAQMAFAGLVQDLYPTVDGLVLVDGGSDGPIVDDAPGNPGGDVIDPEVS